MIIKAKLSEQKIYFYSKKGEGFSFGHVKEIAKKIIINGQLASLFSTEVHELTN